MSRVHRLPALALLWAQACVLHVPALRPRPDVVFPAQDGRNLALELGPAIPDDHVPQENWLGKVQVVEWHASLEAGFRSAFEPWFQLGEERADLILALHEAALEFAPSVDAPTGTQARIRYRAELFDAQGKVLGVAAGTCLSRFTPTKLGEAADSAASAVEVLYEQLAARLFAPPPG